MGVSIHSASPQEVRLAEETIATVRIDGNRLPDRIIADKGYDSDPFRARMAEMGIEMIVPHRRNRTRKKVQDGRALRRYARRWKIERSMAWFGNYRRLVVRWDRSDRIYQAFVHIACALIVLGHL